MLVDVGRAVAAGWAMAHWLIGPFATSTSDTGALAMAAALMIRHVVVADWQRVLTAVERVTGSSTRADAERAAAVRHP